MSHLSDYIYAIRQMLESGNTAEALEKLLELGERFGLSSTQNEAILLKSQLTRFNRDRNFSIMTQESFYAQLSRINYAILDLLVQLEEGRSITPPKTKRDKGRVIHNIPSKMGTGQDCFCSVRIAKDDVILLKGFQKPEDAQPEEVELSRTMEVSLVDPTGGQLFSISQISPQKEQLILDDAFTEWDFMVRPLQTGRAVLFLYIFFIDKVDGQKEKHSVSLKRSIEITTEKVSHYYPWEPTSITIEGEQAYNKNKKIPFVGWSGATAKGLLIGAAALLLGIIGYLGYKYFPSTNPLPPQPPIAKVKAILEVPKGMQVKSVKVDGNTVKGWNANVDTSVIIMPPMSPDTMQVEVTGQKGSCSKVVKVTMQNFRFAMDCKLTLPDSFVVTIVTPFDKPKVSVDGIQDKSHVHHNERSGQKYRTNIKVKKGLHAFRLEDISGRYACKDEIANMVIQSDTVISFNCDTKPISSFNIKAIVPNPYGDKYGRGLRIKVDGKPQSVDGKIEREGWVFALNSIKNIPQTFEIEDHSRILKCKVIRVDGVRPNQIIRFDCQEFFDIKISVPLTGDFVKNFKIKIDNKLVAYTLASERKQSIFYVRNVEGGVHEIKVEGPNYMCNPVAINIGQPNQLIGVRCNIKPGGSFDGVPDTPKPKEKLKSKQGGG